MAAAFMALSLAGDRGGYGGENATESRTLRVLTSHFTPFYYVDENGQTSGLEYKILSSFADANGLELETVFVEDFSEILDDLLRGEGDVVASTLTITEERERRMDFTIPYFWARVVLVIRSGASPADFASLAGKRVLTIRGTTYEQILKRHEGIDLVYVDTENQMYDAVVGGDADALATDSANFLWAAKDRPELQIIRALSGREAYGMAVRTGDPLKERLDDHLRELMRDGTYWDFVEQTYGEVVAPYIDDMKREFREATR